MSDSHLNDLCDLSVCVLIACFRSAHVSGGVYGGGDALHVWLR